jgi:hypothetical protein
VYKKKACPSPEVMDTLQYLLAKAGKVLRLAYELCGCCWRDGYYIFQYDNVDTAFRSIVAHYLESGIAMHYRLGGTI